MFAFRNSQLSFLGSRAQCNVGESFPLTSSGNGCANNNNNNNSSSNNYFLTEWFYDNLKIEYTVIGSIFMFTDVIFIKFYERFDSKFKSMNHHD